MAQLFTIYFPKYYFDLQKEFSLELTFPLPFEYIIEDGNCYISMIHYDQDNEGDSYHWQKKGLQPGLRIIGINCKSLIDDYNHENTILNEEAMEDLLAIGDTEKFIIKFREEVSPQDHSIPLGLTYNKNNIEIEHKNNSISNNQIGASSFENGYEPFQCRFNNPNSFWQPSNYDQTTLDSWLRIDLGMKKMVTKLLLQGNIDHSNYVKSFWIDYSNDCCEWKSHPLGEIRCKYINHNPFQSSQSLHTLLENNSNNLYATIMIWPAIMARFIRIRPCNIYNKIAIRLELYGFNNIHIHNQYARVVTLDDVNEVDRNKLIERVTHLPTNTTVIQVDCKAVISAALDRAGLTNVAFLKSNESNNFTCIFTTSNSIMSERAMDELSEVGVGREMGIISTAAITFRNEPECGIYNIKESRFSDSVKSRMIVKQIIQRIINSSQFTFDYVCMLIVASLIAVGGLATDNSVIVVASMLVSPLMGPVLAFTFGVTLKDYNMAKLGLKNELLSLLICIIVGFIFGFFYSILSMNVNNWPTIQMSSRGTVEGLADGAFIAAASGVGVALSVLGDYLSTVVGVAISASLLPPAVNCGMLFSFPIFSILYPKYIPMNKRYINKRQLLKMAGWSLLLTIENIIIIFVVSRFMFYIKNVYINKEKNNNNNKIWKSVTNFNKFNQMQTNNSIVSLLNEKSRQSFRFSMDNFDTHSLLKGSLLKQLAVNNKNENKNENNTNNIEIGNSHTSAHSNDSNGKNKKKHVNELFTPDIMQQYGYDMQNINDNNIHATISHDRFQ